jgi:hypothetical protein
VPKAERFDAIVLSGHKGLAFEVPFDPGERWGVAPVALRPGRRGVPVRGSVNGKAFEKRGGLAHAPVFRARHARDGEGRPAA